MKRKHVKKVERDKKVSRFTIILSLAFILVTMIICTSIYIKYSNTQTWENYNIKGKQADIPPEFAKNTYDVDVLSDINQLSEINKLLDVIKKDNGLTESTAKDAKAVAQKSEAILKTYNITKGKTFDANEELKLYIKTFDIETTAYSHVNSDDLSNVINALNKKNIENNNETDTKILSRLNKIAKDYTTLNTFLDEYIPQLGTLNNGVLTLNTSVSKTLADEMSTQINKRDLYKFTNIAKFDKTLTSNAWDQAIIQLENKHEKDAWEDVKASFAAMSQSQYYEVSKISTLKDALSINATILGATEKPGFKLLDSSSVQSVTANGMPVQDGQYIRKDAVISVTIKPTYERLETEETSTTETTDTQTSNTHDTHETTSSSTSDTTSSSTMDSTTQSYPEEIPFETETRQNQVIEGDGHG